MAARRGSSNSASGTRRLEGLDGHGHRSPAAQAEGGEAPATTAPPQLVQQRGQDARPGGADGVAEGDGTAVDVDAIPVEAELVAIGQDLRREGLVDLDQVEIVDAATHLLDQA